MSTFRPWGPVSWLMNRLGVARWAVIGCIGAEQRSLAAVDALHASGHTGDRLMYEVLDPESEYTEQILALLAERRNEYLTLGGAERDIVQRDLFATVYECIKPMESLLAARPGNVILDVTSLPKRFFFPMLKRLLFEPADRLKNIVVTYVPGVYPAGVVDLAEVGAWDSIPMFGGEQLKPVGHIVIVGLGFRPYAVDEHLRPTRLEQGFKLLLPFPAPPDAYRKSWDGAMELVKRLPREAVELQRVPASDISETFNRICSLTRNGEIPAEFAPLGPKPVSVAICLFATSKDSRVSYPQPRTYLPNYTIGPRLMAGATDVKGYAIRLNGRDLYKP